MGVDVYLISVLGWKFTLENLDRAIEEFQLFNDPNISDDGDGDSDGDDGPPTSERVRNMNIIAKIAQFKEGSYCGELYPEYDDTITTVDGLRVSMKIHASDYKTAYVYFGVHYTDIEKKATVPTTDVLKFHSIVNGCDDFKDFIEYVTGTYEQPSIHSRAYLS